MRKLNNQINLDRAVGAEDNASKQEATMRNASKKTPWHLRFAPGALSLKGIAATAGIGTIYGLLFAGLLLMPFQPHRATAAAPPVEETVEAQGVWFVPIVAGVIATVTVMAFAAGVKYVWNEMKTPNGTLVAETDIAVESLDGATSFWYVGRGFTGERNSFSQWKYDEDDASAEELKSHYQYWDIWVAYVQWDEGKEYYVATDSQSFWGDLFYLPGCINSAYNYGNYGDEDTGNTGYVIESGYAEMNHLTHVFDSQVNEWDADPDLEDRGFTYNPEVRADISDMRYDVTRNSRGQAIKVQGWIYTPRTDKTVKTASDMPADEDATQTVDLLSLSSRLDNYRMRVNKSKLYWKRTKKEISARHPATATFSDGSTMPTNMPSSSTWTGPLPKQKITTENW